MDSTHWNDFRYRDDDIVIASWGKAGTTWVQQIVGQLIFDGDPDLRVSHKSLWLECLWPSKRAKLKYLEAQQHRRFVKTHLPVPALAFSPKAKYIYVGRDGRDIAWSLHHHLMNFTDEFYEMVNSQCECIGATLERPSSDFRCFWHDWLRQDGYPMWPFWENIRSWWSISSLPNVRLVHFEDLKRDLPKQIRYISQFLGIPIKGEASDRILEHCSFDWMKSNARKVVPLGLDAFKGGASMFLKAGTNRRWREVLSDAEVAEYEERAKEELGHGCAHWLLNGRNENAGMTSDSRH